MSIVLRSAVFHLAAAILTLAFLPLLPLIVLPVARWWPVLALYLRLLAWLLKTVCGIRYELRGKENLPSGPCLIASGHESAWEIFFFPLLFDNPAFFVKAEIFRYPLIGPVVRRSGHISTARSGDLDEARRGIEQAAAHARQGRSILIFPTGTRSHSIADAPLRHGVAVLYARLGLPCVPVVLNSGKVWPYGSLMKYPGVVVVEILPAIAPGLDRRAFLDRLHTQMQAAREALDMGMAPETAPPAAVRR